MPVYQKLVDFNQMLLQLQQSPVFINDLRNETEEDRDALRELVTSRYSSDMISMLPSCRCGVTKGEFSKKTICPECGTPVKSSIETEIEPTIWFRRPIGVSKLISPIILIMLKQRFKKSGFNIIQWLIDTTYRPQVKQPPVINKIVQAGIQRGYNNFVEKFDEIMTYLFNLKDFKRKETDYLFMLLAENRHKIFFDNIPLLNKSLLIIEKTNLGIYVDSIIVDAIDAIETLVSIDRSFHDQNPRVKENRTAKALCKLTDFYEQFFKMSISPKNGQFRRHIFGSRTNFAFRAVITSITDVHRHDEIHVPWGIGLTAFRFHLVNKLMKYGYDLNQAHALIFGHIEKYHPLLDQLLQELISDADNNLVCIIQRNPSLLQGSALKVRITKFKKDPTDRTISLSILVVKFPNADFDGKLIAVITSNSEK